MVSALPLLAVSAAHAQSQSQSGWSSSYSRLVVFGDSLSDNGNLYTATGTPTSPPYNKRYTNDLVWAEYLTGGLQGWYTATSYTSGSIDLAWGGARSDSAANSNGPVPGTPTQIGYYQAHGGNFGANDVASMWIGANDIFQGLPAAAASPANATTIMTGVAGGAAGNAATQVGSLASAGAKTIIVMNLPDLGSTPQFSGSATTSAIATYSSTVFNTALDTGLKAQAAAHTGTNIIEVDINSAFHALLANPQAFGLNNVTQACVLVTACVTGGASTQNGYLFWDTVHPTATGHKVISALVAQYLYTPSLASGVGMLADETYETRRANGAMLADELHGPHGSEGDNRWFVSAVGDQAARDSKISEQASIGGTASMASVKAYDYNLSGFHAGAVHTAGGNVSLGVAMTALQGKAKAFMVSANPTDVSIDLGLDWRMGGHFVSLSGGAGFASFGDFRRTTMVGPLTEGRNEVRAQSLSAAVQAGFDHDMGGWMLTPLVRLSYADAKMSSFSEIGPLASVAYGDRDVNAVSAAAELRAAGQLSDAVKVDATIGYEGVLSGKEGDLKGRLINNTALPFADNMGKVGSPGLLVGLGVGMKVAKLDIKASYRGTFGSQSQRNQAAMLTLSKAF
jgi:outer membrane lipase/esterase